MRSDLVCQAQALYSVFHDGLGFCPKLLFLTYLRICLSLKKLCRVDVRVCVLWKQGFTLFWVKLAHVKTRPQEEETYFGFWELQMMVSKDLARGSVNLLRTTQIQT